MAEKITKKDIPLLEHIAAFKILTVKQLALLSHRSEQVIRRRLRVLLQTDLVNKLMRGLGRSKGRPEEIFFLTGTGAKFLTQNTPDKNDFFAIPDTALRTLPVDHDLLINWFHLYLIQVEQKYPQMSINGLSTNTTPSCQAALESRFIPDGIFTITDKESSKSLLFFLEVDMGSETAASTDRNHHDFRQKVLNYQELFRSARYKQCEKTFRSSFNGFRLLIMTNTPARHITLCRLVQEMPPSDFIWLTDQNRMFNNGLGDKIWQRGGRNSKPSESVLGSFAFKTGGI